MHVVMGHIPVGLKFVVFLMVPLPGRIVLSTRRNVRIMVENVTHRRRERIADQDILIRRPEDVIEDLIVFDAILQLQFTVTLAVGVVSVKCVVRDDAVPRPAVRRVCPSQ